MSALPAVMQKRNFGKMSQSKVGLSLLQARLPFNSPLICRLTALSSTRISQTRTPRATMVVSVATLPTGQEEEDRGASLVEGRISRRVSRLASLSLHLHKLQLLIARYAYPRLPAELVESALWVGIDFR